MDNGLIFPYPLARAHVEPADTNRAISVLFLRGWGGGRLGPEVVVGK